MRKILCAILFLATVSVACAFSQPAAAPGDTWTFAVLCDTRGDNEPTLRKTCINEIVLQVISQNIADERCDLVIVPGDLVNGWWASGGTDYYEQFLNWRKAMDPVYKAGIPVYPVRGNHENCSREPYPPPDPELLEAYLDVFSSDIPLNGPPREEYLTYYVENRNALFVGMDQYITPHRANTTWLSDTLTDHSAPFMFVYGHEPAYRVCHEDCLGSYPSERDAFWGVLSEHGVVAYFCGHDHLTYAQIDTSQLPPYQILVGGGGAPLVANKTFYDPAKCPLAPELGEQYTNNSSYGYVIGTVTTTSVELVFRYWEDPADAKNWTDVLLLSYSPTIP